MTVICWDLDSGMFCQHALALWPLFWRSVRFVREADVERRGATRFTGLGLHGWGGPAWSQSCAMVFDQFPRKKDVSHEAVSWYNLRRWCFKASKSTIWFVLICTSKKIPSESIYNQLHGKTWKHVNGWLISSRNLPSVWPLKSMDSFGACQASEMRLELASLGFRRRKSGQIFKPMSDVNFFFLLSLC